MDIKKAQRLINKIQAFLDNGNAQDLSRLEKDLIKSYVTQLYEAVTDDQVMPAHQEEEPVRFVEHKMPKREPAPRVEIPQVREIEELMPEIPPPFYTDHEHNTPQEKHIEVEIPVHIPEKTQPEAKSFQFTPEPIKETAHAPKSNRSAADHEGLAKLFDITKTDEMSGRFSHVPISSIESAMGLNERIFTLNELFGGNKSLFDDTCAKLNNFNSFAEARNMLMGGPATDFNWSAPERQKMAEQFIRIVSRRYPKSVS
ncbi:MAG TPA: hypothetical protein VFG10_04635 [Saprospiraceae bacterium]|nr:hypothetical protein [Saprospiraceae bacterium]